MRTAGRRTLLAGGFAALLAVLGWWLAHRGGVGAVHDADEAGSSAAATTADPGPSGEPHDAARLAPVRATAGESPPPRVGGPRVTGRVVDHDGHGIAGAHVVSIPDNATVLFLPSAVRRDGGAARDASADSEGRFAVPVERVAPYFAVYADAPGYGGAAVAGVSAGDDVTVVLERPAAVAGHVTEASGAPVSGARVRFHGFLDAVRIDLESTTDVSGAYRIEGVPPAGRVASRAYAVSACALEVAAEGFAPILTESALFGLAPGGTSTRDFVLTPGATLEGKVLDVDSGAPIEGARVVLWSVELMSGYGRPSGSSLSAPWAPRTLGETRTLADGSFRFEHVPAEGRNRVESNNGGKRGPTLGHVIAWKANLASATEEIAVPQDGATVTVTVRLAPAAVVVGRVLATDGSPAVGATVSASVEGRAAEGWVPRIVEGPPRSFATTDAEGRYRVDGVPVFAGKAARAKVVARLLAPGVRDWRAVSTADSSVEVSPGSTATAPDLVLAAAPNVLRGVVRVLDPDGKPVWGATIGEEFGGQRTDESGRATIVAVSDKPPPPRSVAIRCAGFAVATAVVPLAAEPTEVEVRLEHGHRLSGRVLDASGAPKSATIAVANAAVPVEDAVPADARFWQTPRPKPGQPALLLYANVPTAEDGSFTVENLPQGPYHVVASAGPRSGGLLAKPLRAVLRDVATDAHDLVLTLPVDDSPATGRLEGTVVDESTARPPAFDVAVTLRRGSTIGGFASARSSMPSAQSHGTVDASGRFSFPAAPAGTWTLTVQAAGYAPATTEGVDVLAGETRTLPPIALGRGIVVTGTARAAAGLDLTSYALSFRGIDDAAYAGSGSPIAADGSYRASGLVPGRYLVSCTSQGTPVGPRGEPTYYALDATPVVTVGPAREQRIDVALVQGGVLRVDARDPRLPPSPWDGTYATAPQRAFGDAVRAELRGADGATIVGQRGATQGSFGLLSSIVLAPGRYVLRVEAPGEAARDVPIEIEAGKSLHVDSFGAAR